MAGCFTRWGGLGLVLSGLDDEGGGGVGGSGSGVAKLVGKSRGEVVAVAWNCWLACGSGSGIASSGSVVGSSWGMVAWVSLSRWWCGRWLGSMGERWQEIRGGQGAGGVLVGSCLAGLSLAFRRLLGPG